MFYLAPVRNTVKTCTSWLLPHTTIQPLTPVMNIKEHIILDCIISHNHKDDIYKSHHKSVSTGLALQLVLTKVMARAMAMFLSWAVVRLGKYLEQ